MNFEEKSDGTGKITSSLSRIPSPDVPSIVLS